MIHRVLGRAVPLGIALLVLPAAAAPVGPVRVERDSWRLGLEAGFAFDREFEVATAGADEARFEKRNAYLLSVEYGFADWLNIYGRLGAAKLIVFDKPDAFAQPNDLYDLGTEFAWSVGVRGIVRRDVFPLWDLAVTAEYLEHEGHDGEVRRGTNARAPLRDFDFREWTIALLFQRTDLAPWLPYVGPTFGDARVRRGRRNAVPVGAAWEAEDHVGVAVGTGYDFGDGWFGYLEGRLVDESSVNVGMFFAF